jgi:hypothetical protein
MDHQEFNQKLGMTPDRERAEGDFERRNHFRNTKPFTRSATQKAKSVIYSGFREELAFIPFDGKISVV